MSKVIEAIDALLLEGASRRMAVLYTVEKFQLGNLAARQLWAHYDLNEQESRDV